MGERISKASRVELRRGDQAHPPDCEEACGAGVRTATRGCVSRECPQSTQRQTSHSLTLAKYHLHGDLFNIIFLTDLP